MADLNDRLEPEHQAIKRLSTDWNAFVRGGIEAADMGGLDGAVVRAVHALDTAPDPSPAFLGRLKEDLMRAEPVVAATPRPRHASLPALLNNGTVPAQSLQHAGRSRRRTWRLAAAAVLAIVAGYSGMALWSGGGNPSEPTMLPAYGAASAAALPWQETPECDVPTRPPESFEALLAVSEAGTPPAALPSDEAGEPADAATVAAIETTVRELTACRNARQQGRHYALWTDAAILRAHQEAKIESEYFSLLAVLLQAGEYIEQLEGTPEAVSDDLFWTVEAIEDVRVLPDGRVRATVRYGTSDGELPLVTYFVERDGVYLLDDAEGWTYEAVDAGGGTPVAEEGDAVSPSPGADGPG